MKRRREKSSTKTPFLFCEGREKSEKKALFCSWEGGREKGKKKQEFKKKGEESAQQHTRNKGPKSRKDFLDLFAFRFFLAIPIIPYNNSLRAQTLSLSLSLFPTLFYKKNESVLSNERERARHGEW